MKTLAECNAEYIAKLEYQLARPDFYNTETTSHLLENARLAAARIAGGKRGNMEKMYSGIPASHYHLF